MKTSSSTLAAPENKPVTDESSDASAKTRGKKGLAAAQDAALTERFKAGDEAAFSEIISRYYPRILSLAQQILHNHADAEEVAQDTFIRAHRGLHNFRGDSSLSTWLYCIASNLARNRYWFFFRRRRQDTVSFDQPVGDESNITLAGRLTDGRVDPQSDTMTNEFVSIVSTCMEQLDASHREVLQMRTVLDLSYEEIAENLKINVGTVKSRIARARESLRELMAKTAPEFGRTLNLRDFFEFDRSIPGLTSVPA